MIDDHDAALLITPSSLERFNFFPSPTENVLIHPDNDVSLLKVY